MAEATLANPIPYELPRRRSRLRWLWSLAKRKPIAAISLVVLVIFLFVGIGAPWISPEDPLLPSRARLQSPSMDHYLGTDQLGRDVLSRAMWGARTSLLTGFSVSLMATTLGLALGGISGFLGGRFDILTQRVVETVQSLPPLIIAMVLVTIVGAKVYENIPITVIIALTIIGIPASARIARAAALSVAALPFVEAAESVGATKMRLFLRHILPNIVAPMLVVATVQLGSVILAEASLSFLGVGTPPPTPSWGTMISGDARSYLKDAPWMALTPGAGITLAVLAFNFLGDGIRDLVDPRLRGR